MDPKDFALIPLGLVDSAECMFFSHMWRSKDHPDPEQEDLALLKKDLQTISEDAKYIWIDYCCLPQHDHLMIESQKRYAERALGRIPALVLKCSFHWHYPVNDVRNRAWILYEICLFNIAHTMQVPIDQDNQKYIQWAEELFKSDMTVREFFEARDISPLEKCDLSYIYDTLQPFLELRRQNMTSINIFAAILGSTNFLYSSRKPEGAVNIVSDGGHIYGADFSEGKSTKRTWND